jgi:predicted CoA-substrate-specific enzyme activase
MKYSIGLDVGSTSSELVLMDSNKEIVYLDKKPSGVNMIKVGEQLISDCLKEKNLQYDNIMAYTVTGYGRKQINLSGMEKVEKTEITCYGKGASFLNPETRTIIDMGGQDSKVIALDDQGKVKNFAMNDKCAAGTGRFLEMIAKHFELSLDQLGPLTLASTKEVTISNICAVFAESEIISLVSQGVAIEDILQAVGKSITKRVFGMAERVGVRETVMFCGGVALNQGMVGNFESILGKTVFLPKHLEFVGAIGAALFAQD